VTDVVSGLRPWKRVGGTIMITMGLLLGGSELEKYYHNPYFWVKMSILCLVAVHALVFRPTVYNNTEAIDRAPRIPGRAKAAALLSLTLWLGIMTMGRLIGYYEGDKSKTPAGSGQVTELPVQK
jgi:hypothetical protein